MDVMSVTDTTDAMEPARHWRLPAPRPVALAVSAVAPSYDFFSYYMTLVITPMFILCGVFYPITSMPEVVQHAVLALPLTHAVALVRPLVTGAPVEFPLVHLAVLAGFAASGFYVAVALVRRRFIV